MTDKEQIAKYLDDYQASYGKPMSSVEFIDKFQGHEKLYDNIGEELEREGRLKPAQPEEIQEAVFGKPPPTEFYRTITVKPYQRRIHYYHKEGGYVSQVVNVKGYTRKVKVK